MDLPRHALARVEPALSWTHHPYLDDTHPAYNVPAALLEWLLREPVEASILLLDSGSVLRQAVSGEAVEGAPLAQSWDAFPTGDGPFDLPQDYRALQAYCVKRDLRLPKVRLPMLIHSRDLLKICPRWLELIGILRSTRAGDAGSDAHVLYLALAVAAAEYELEVAPRDMAREIMPADSGSAYAAYVNAFDAACATGSQLGALRPRRRPGVRQACVLDRYYLELGSSARLMSLNVSASAIWKLCDGQRSLEEIIGALQATYAIPREAMAADVIETAKSLKAEGAINLELPPQ